MKKTFFTSESVTEGHPDKVCDQIADGVLDAILKNDPAARVACECSAATGLVLVMGEITTNTYVDVQSIARNTINNIGYTGGRYGFDGSSCAVISTIHEQSSDIAMGVNKALEAKKGELTDRFDTGAGDQGMMFGYACDDTAELMPITISLAHKLAKQLAKVRKDGTLPYLGPDGKSQVTIEFHDDIPARADAVVISSQHDDKIEHETIRTGIIEHVIAPIIPSYLLDKNTKIYINPTGWSTPSSSNKSSD